MTLAQIVADPKTVRPGRLGPATGTIWLSIGQDSFPVEGWNDFVVVILERWADAALRLLLGFSDYELVHFMEGPYEVHMAKTSVDTFRLTARERGGAVEATVDTSAVEFVAGLLRTSEEILTECRRQECWSPDAAKLGAHLPELREQASRLRS